MSNYNPQYVPTITPMMSPMRYIEELLKEHFFATELYTTEMMQNEAKSPNECVQYVYNLAYDFAKKAKEGKVGASCGDDALLIQWAMYYYNNDVKVAAMPRDAVGVSITKPSAPKPSAADIKASAQAAAKADVEKVKKAATKVAKDAKKTKEEPKAKANEELGEGAKPTKPSGWVDTTYLEEGEKEDKPMAPIIELPPKGNAPKVSSQFKRGSKEYKEALRKQSEENDLFAGMFD